MKRRTEAPQRSGSFPWETQTFTRWAGTMAFPNPCPAHWGQYLLFARRFFLLQLQSRKSCNLADDSIVSPSPLGCVTATAAPQLSQPAPASQGSAARPRGGAGAPGASGARALRAGGRTPRAQLPRLSLPKHFSGVACLAPGEQHYPIASRFIRRLGAERA